MLAAVQSGALVGVEALPVSVEVNSGESGEFRMVMVGLPDAAVKESADRVASALQNSGYRPPQSRTTVNLAPGDLRKEGPFYDLPIALGILEATAQIDFQGELKNYLVAGELGLGGELRPVKGALALAVLAKKRGLRLMLPEACAKEATLVEGVEVVPVRSLDGAAQILAGKLPAQVLPAMALTRPEGEFLSDFSEVKGQAALRRAVEVAVAGGHNLIVIGPPGSGKSMIAKRIPSILPLPTREEFLEILAIHSAAGMTLDGALRFERPFRAPHHTISDVGLLGGGTFPKPGEVSLAHHGVLFLDEFPEFSRSAMEVLRQPLEDGEVTISRSAAKITLPCRCMLVAAMNPCPCGHLGDPAHRCRCTPTQIQHYRARVSGPILDRIDIHVEARAVSVEAMRGDEKPESSATIRERVEKAREVQQSRQASPNATLHGTKLRELCALGEPEEKILISAMNRLRLSARAHDRILKVARTIADLAGANAISAEHLMEAISYRSLDRQE
jgi:magnesium chelatase family protein